MELAGVAVKEGQSVLIIVTRIGHGKALTEKLLYKGTMAFFVQGASTIKERQKSLSILAHGLPQAIVATPIFDEGVDVPALDVIILACGGKSHIKLLQRIGRGLRRKDGDNILHVYDFLDDTNKYLLNHSEERIDVYRKEAFQVEYVESVESVG